MFNKYRAKTKTVSNPNDIFASKMHKRNDVQLTVDNLSELNK